MKIFNCVILGFGALFCSLSLATGSGEITGESREALAAQETIDLLVQEIRDLKAGESGMSTWDQSSSIFQPTHRGRRHCDEDDSQNTCVPQCSVRGSSGNCLSYGADFCGPNASCSPNCSVRGTSGNCLSYSGDFCGPYASCTPNCSVRGSSGNCLSYGPDICR